MARRGTEVGMGTLAVVAAALATVGGGPAECAGDPVVLVHGLGATAETNWGTVRPALERDGHCVFAITYGVDPRLPGRVGGTVPMERSARELDAFVDEVLEDTGAEQVDLVGHSEGTVMPRYYLERLGGAARVDAFVALTPLWRGTELELPFAAEAFCGACPQLLAGSDYLDDLNADGEAVPGVEHTNVVTTRDAVVQPPSSGLMRDGGTNIVLQDVCPEKTTGHAEVAFDPAVVRLIRNTLSPGKAPNPC